MHYGLRRHAAPLRDAAPSTSASCRLLWAGPHSAHHLRELAPTVGMAASSHPSKPSKYRFRRRTECLYSARFESNAPLLAAGFRYLFNKVRLPSVWSWLFRWRIGSTSSLRSSLAKYGSRLVEGLFGQPINEIQDGPAIKVYGRAPRGPCREEMWKRTLLPEVEQSAD